MALFIHETTSITAPDRPRMSMLAVLALVIAASGFVTLIGFLVAPAVAIVALVRLARGRARGENTRGRGLAIAALWISLLVLIVGSVALLTILAVAYASLPTPHFF